MGGAAHKPQNAQLHVETSLSVVLSAVLANSCGFQMKKREFSQNFCPLGSEERVSLVCILMKDKREIEVAVQWRFEGRGPRGSLTPCADCPQLISS